jgi:hypothetical protein
MIRKEQAGFLNLNFNLNLNHGLSHVATFCHPRRDFGRALSKIISHFAQSPFRPSADAAEQHFRGYKAEHCKQVNHPFTHIHSFTHSIILLTHSFYSLTHFTHDSRLKTI